MFNSPLKFPAFPVLERLVNRLDELVLVEAFRFSKPCAGERLRLDRPHRLSHLFLEAACYAQQVDDEPVSVHLLLFEAFQELDDLSIRNVEAVVSG